MISILLDWLLGERCHACHRRIFPADAVRHYTAECPGVIR